MPSVEGGPFRRAARLLCVLSVLAAWAGGCREAIRFPADPLQAVPTETGARVAYDTDGDGRADYFADLNARGRKDRIAYDTDADGKPDVPLDLDAISPQESRHVVIVLDGVPFEEVWRAYDDGLLRLFHPPVRLVSPFPTMTDIALADVFGSARPTGYEALYFDQETDRLAGGDRFYLAMSNEPWTSYLDYRADTLTDALGYLFPKDTFRRELVDFKAALEESDDADVNAYFVSTAGIGSRAGRQGIRDVLKACDRLVEQLVWESRGRTEVTLLADHGHTLRHCERIDFAGFLRKRGWHVTKRLARTRDVVPVEYGLVTYAAFGTDDRDALADDLLYHDAVSLTAYPEDDHVVLRSRGGTAFVEHQDGRYRYRALMGDPLELGPVVERLEALGQLDADGFAAEADWFRETFTHRYPDPLERVWRAFHGLTKNTPDVVANLCAGRCAGAAGKRAWIPYVASTHGDLGRSSTTTFIMSTAGPIAGPGDDLSALRSRDVPQALTALMGRPWPGPPHDEE